MKMIKTLLLASTLVAGGAMAANAQSTMTPAAAGSGSVSATTHCTNASGQVVMKNAGSGTTGAATSAGTNTAGSAASGSGSGSAAGAGAASSASNTTSQTGSGATNLPKC